MNETERSRSFFDRHAPTWDEHASPSDGPAITRILDRFVLPAGAAVLDVACGTGALTPFLLQLNVLSITSLDSSPEMCGRFAEKFPRQKILCQDFETAALPRAAFDAVIIFNAFPHFPHPQAVFEQAFSALKPGGRLLIAHSMNRAELDAHHRRAGREVAHHVLMPDTDFFQGYRAAGFEAVTVDNGAYFYSEGRRPAEPAL